MTLQELVQEYLRKIEERQLAPSTQRGYRYIFSHWLQSTDGHRAVSGLTCEDIADYLKHLGSLNYSSSTMHSHLQALRACLHWAHLEGYLAKNLAQLFRPKLPSAPAAWVPTVDQVEQLLKAPPATRLGWRDRFVLEMCYGSGLRRSELSALNVSDVQGEGGLWVRYGKGGRDRLQPLGPGCWKQLQFYLERVRPQLWPGPEQDALLLTRSGERLTGEGIAGVLRLYREPLGLTQMTIHSLRRAYATHMLQRGAPLGEIQKLLGHEYLQTTLRYTQIGVGDMQKDYQRCHPRARRAR